MDGESKHNQGGLTLIEKSESALLKVPAVGFAVDSYQRSTPKAS